MQQTRTDPLALMHPATSEAAIRAATERLLPSRKHANYWRWRQYHESARWRGELVAELVAPLLSPGSFALDIGCGVGGTGVALASGGAMVLALELDRCRLKSTGELARAADVKINAVQGDGCTLPVKDGTMDVVILQDVLEHVGEPKQLLHEVTRVLKKGGVAFVSTPNRWSPWNLLSDPHWGLPIVGALPRWAVALFTRRRRSESPGHTPVPALLSLRLLRKLMRDAGLMLSFANRAAARFIAREPRAAFCASWHLRLANWAKRLGMLGWLPRFVNDRSGIFNWWLNPTWYILARKT